MIPGKSEPHRWGMKSWGSFVCLLGKAKGPEMHSSRTSTFPEENEFLHEEVLGLRCRGRWLGKGIGLKNTFVIPARGVFRHDLGEEVEEGWGRRGA